MSQNFTKKIAIPFCVGFGIYNIFDRTMPNYIIKKFTATLCPICKQNITGLCQNCRNRLREKMK